MGLVLNKYFFHRLILKNNFLYSTDLVSIKSIFLSFSFSNKTNNNAIVYLSSLIFFKLLMNQLRFKGLFGVKKHKFIIKIKDERLVSNSLIIT